MTRAELAQTRAQAEQWHQLVRSWRPVRDRAVTPRISYAAFRERPDDWLDTLGSCAPDRPTWLLAPHGMIRESECAGLISAWCVSGIAAQRDAGMRLDRVRSGWGPRSLLDPRGGWAGGCNATEYAIAALALGLALGDPLCQRALDTIRET